MVKISNRKIKSRQNGQLGGRPKKPVEVPITRPKAPKPQLVECVWCGRLFHPNGIASHEARCVPKNYYK